MEMELNKFFMKNLLFYIFQFIDMMMEIFSLGLEDQLNVELVLGLDLMSMLPGLEV